MPSALTVIPEVCWRAPEACIQARVAIEQASTFGWERYTGGKGRVIGMHTFGASAPLKELQKKFGFEPDQVVQQVEPLRRLVQGRQRISDLLSKMDGNEKLEGILQDILQNTSTQQQLGSQLGIDTSKGDSTKKEEPK